MNHLYYCVILEYNWTTYYYTLRYMKIWKSISMWICIYGNIIILFFSVLSGTSSGLQSSSLVCWSRPLLSTKSFSLLISFSKRTDSSLVSHKRKVLLASGVWLPFCEYSFMSKNFICVIFVLSISFSFLECNSWYAS